ncbi:MAG: LamG domain-containing protein, partial [Gammaproteobacteria bacterium]|nr:LamG domain-containing protein [Gammaproteobacteria bacterium]
AGSDRLMLVGVSLLNEDLETVTSVTYNGTGLTFVGQVSQGNDSRVEIWAYVNPPVTTANVVVTFNEQVQLGAIVGIVTFTGVDQATPYGAFQSNSGDSTTASATVSSSNGELVFGVMAAKRQDGGPTVAGGTQQWSLKSQPGNNRTAGAGASFSGAASVNLSWNLVETDDWAVGAISLRDAGAGGVVCDTFRDEFSSTSYARQDGTANWAGNWNEVGDNGSPANGDIQIGSNSLQLEGDGAAGTVLGGPYIEREANLAPYASATLSFDYRETGNWEGNDDIEVYLSDDGGGSWNLIQTFTNDQGGTFQNFSTDISTYIAADTRVAFVEKANNGAEVFYVDNLQIEACSTGNTPLAYYAMNEAAWSGAAGEVIDSSGNGNDGSAVGNANTVDPGRICLGGDIPFNSSAAAQDAIDTGLDMDTDIGTSGTISFWYKPDTAWAGGGDRMLVDASTTTDNKYFFLALLSNGALRFRFEDSTDADFQLDTTAKAFAAGEWHHIAITWTLPGDRLEIYIDGVLDTSSTPNTSGIWGALGSVYLGDNRSTYHPSGTPNSANGVLDEARIYDVVQSASEIQTDMNDPGSCLAPYAWFQLDATPGNWNGSAGEVVDQQGAVTTAFALGTGAGVDSVSTPICRGIDIPLNTSDGAQYGFDSSIDADDDIGNSGTISFWYKSDNAWAGGGDRALFDASPDSLSNPDKFFLLMLGNDGALQFAVEDATDSDFLFNTAAQGFGTNVWVHVAVTWEMSGNRQIFINGSLAATDTRATSGALGELDTFYFGDNRSSYHFGGTANSANGVIDEVRVYDSVLTQVQINTDMTATHSCATSTVDHFRISPATISASTCLPNAITIVAADASDNPIPDYTGTVDITTSTNHGNWSVNTASNPTVPNPDTDDNGAVAYSFVVADVGDIVLDLSNDLAETLAITVTDSSAGVSDTSVNITFSDNVFIIYEDPIQVAGRDQAMRIEMWVRDSGPDPSCGPDPDYNYNHNLDVSIDRAGVLPLAVDPVFNAVTLATVPDGPATASVQVDFSGGTGSAVFDLETSDVGQYRLTITDNTGTHIPIPITGSSALLTVRPFGIGVSNIRAGATVNMGFTGPNDLEFTIAGADFEATVAGVLWMAGDDTDDNGVFDTGFYYDNPVAPSYAWTTVLSVSGAALSYTPDPGTPGVLNNATILQGEFGGGFFNVTDLQYTEVGSFTLQSSADDFLGDPRPSYDLVGDDIVIGRFRPDEFSVQITEHGVFDNACGTFTYIGQAFSYATAPTIKLRALNALGNPTAQYRGGFNKLSAGSVSVDATEDESMDGTDLLPLQVGYTAAAMSITKNTDGSTDYSFGADIYRYGPEAPATFSKFAESMVDPFDADIDPEISAVTDGEITSNFPADTYLLNPDPL